MSHFEHYPRSPPDQTAVDIFPDSSVNRIGGVNLAVPIDCGLCWRV
jgi:hypothetical protein